MEVSWGFIIVLLLVLFPGLIIRRLYYYGEFSKQFASGYSLIRVIAVSSIPGLVNLVVIYFFYDFFITEVDLGKVIDSCKDIANPKYKHSENPGMTIRETLNTNVLPFLFFLYISSFLIGILSGRLVRITGIDTKFKLLRYKNYWFYFFSGQHIRFKKMRHLRSEKKKHVFTLADILIDTNSKTLLYSGFVVDYELDPKDSQTLSKVILRNAERYSYSKDEDRKIAKVIPGNLLVVDCSTMKNINLTYVFEKTEDFLSSWVPGLVTNSVSLLILLLIPIFIFQADAIKWQIYIDYFEYPWYERVLFYLLTIQVLNLVNPFIKNSETEGYEYIGWKMLKLKILWLIILGILIWIL